MSSKKSYKVIAYFSIVPVGQETTSMGSYVAEAIGAMNKVEGVNCEITPMGTVMEADNLEVIFKAVKLAHEAMASKGIFRIESTLLIDERMDKPRSMQDKVNTVKKYLKQV